MKILTDGYGLFFNKKSREALILNPGGVEKWKQSNQTLGDAMNLISGGAGIVLSQDQIAKMVQNTSKISLLGPVDTGGIAVKG